MTSIGGRISRAALNLYQRHISPEYNGVRGVQCGYHSSCSGYAKETLQLDGLAGLPAVLARLRRCTSENTGQRFGDFLRYTANCPTSRVDEFFEFDTPELRQTFLSFRRQLLQGATQLANHQDQAGLETINAALDQLTQKAQFTVADPPAGAERSGAVIQIHPRRAARPTVMEDRGRWGNALRGAASIVTGSLAAVVGGVAGLILGPMVGAWEGLASGLGLRTTVESWANEKYGAGSLAGTTPLRERAQKTYEGLQNRLGLEAVSNVVGGAVGLSVGLVGGLLGGATEGASTAWSMGRVLGRSLGDSALDGVFPSRGKMEVAAPPHHHSSAEESAPVDERAQRLWNILSHPPDPLRSQERPAGAPSWRFAVFSDATPSELESAEVRRVMEFERNLPIGTSARIHLRRGNLVPAGLRKVWPWVKLVSSVAGLAATGGLSGVALAPILLARGVALGMSASAVKELVRDALTEKEPDWTGQRVYELTESVTEKAGHIHTTPMAEHKAVGAVCQDRLAQDLAASFSQGGPRVAVFTGHGKSYQKIAGYDPKVLAGALQQTAEKTGQKTDLVVLEGCFTATLEALQGFSGGARYALVSQLPVRKVGLPWSHILKNIDELGQDPKTLGSRIVELAGGSESVPSLSLIDLSQVENLTTQLEALASGLSPEILARALPAGDIHPQEGLGKTLLRKLTRWLPGSQSGDLAGILKKLEAELTRPEDRARLSRVQEALAAVVVSARGEGLGGLSVETAAPMFDGKAYQGATRMQAWGQGLASAQPTLLKPLAAVAGWADRSWDRVGDQLIELRYGQPAGAASEEIARG